jgi:chromosome segregation ATPase
MDLDRASELSKSLHQVTDFMTQRTQLCLKRDAELKAYNKRKQEYEDQISKPVQFPAVHDLFQGHQNHHKQTIAAIDKDLDAIAQKAAVALNKYAQSLVRASPIDKTTSAQSTQDERLKKLEQRQTDLEESWKKQLTSLQNNQEKQASELASYREKDTLRIDLQKENEQLRGQVSSLRSEVTDLTQQIAMFEPAAKLKAELSNLVEETKLEFTKADQDKPDSAQYVALLQETTALRQSYGELNRQIEALGNTSTSHTEQIAALSTDMGKHEALLANIDVETLDEAIGDYTTLKSRVGAQDLVVNDLKQSMTECITKISEMPADLPTSFQEWSDSILKFCAKKMDEHTTQIKVLQDSLKNLQDNELATRTTTAVATAFSPQPNASLVSELEVVTSSMASAESRLTEVETKATAIDSKLNTLQDILTTLGSQADRRYVALETMVESLSSQWNNINTTQMAYAILEQLSGLQPAQLVPEIRHFQERLLDVERLLHEHAEQRKNQSMRMQSVCEDIAKAPKRGLEEEIPGQYEKRARIESQNGVTGYDNDNGNVHHL